MAIKILRFCHYYLGNNGIVFRTCRTVLPYEDGLQYCKPQWFCRNFRKPTENQMRELIRATRYEF